MSHGTLAAKADDLLRQLCLAHPSRRVGTRGNAAATDLFAAAMRSHGFVTEEPAFECIDWAQDGASLTVGGQAMVVQVSPYSLGGSFQAPLAVASTVEELQAADLAGRIVLLRGELAKEQLMPKGFPFYNPEEHQRIYALLEARPPLAIIAATARNPELAAALYPFPLFEDGDFDIPSVFLTDVEGDRLARLAGAEAVLSIVAERFPATGVNVVARKGSSADRRLVFTAHIDAKDGTPGALDDATGIVTLLLLAEMLEDYRGRLTVEIVAMNGEDYYNAPGEQLYVRRNAGRWGEVVLNVNLDGLGYRKGGTAYSLYECPPAVEDLCRLVLPGYPGMVEGMPWYQGDHGIFIQNGCPALAITSEQMAELWQEVAHTPKDEPDIVDASRLVTAAHALHELVWMMERRGRMACRKDSERW